MLTKVRLVKAVVFAVLMYGCVRWTVRKAEGSRRKGQQRMAWLEGITDSMDTSLSKLRETVKDRQAWRAVVHEVTESRTRLGY